MSILLKWNHSLTDKKSTLFRIAESWFLGYSKNQKHVQNEMWSKIVNFQMYNLQHFDFLSVFINEEEDILDF